MSFKITYSVQNADMAEVHKAFDAALVDAHRDKGQVFPSWVAGQPRTSGPVIAAHSPIDTRWVTASCHAATATDIDDAVKEARAAQPAWARMPWQERVAILNHAADLIICRAGATTVAEVAAMGKAVIFIPFPFAADNHQVLNARTLADDGAALMVEEKEVTGAILAKWIDHYFENPRELARMAALAAKKGNPDAAGTIVDDIYQLLASSGV